MSKHCNPFRLIAIGLGVWTLSTAGCGLAVGKQSQPLSARQMTESADGSPVHDVIDSTS